MNMVSSGSMLHDEEGGVKCFCKDKWGEWKIYCFQTEADIKEKYVCSSGPGGQNVNKTASCVYLKHVGSGLEMKIQRERSQGLNRYYARKRLCELIEQEKLGSKSPAAIKAEKIRKQKKRRKRRGNKTRGLGHER